MANGKWWEFRLSSPTAQGAEMIQQSVTTSGSPNGGLSQRPHALPRLALLGVLTILGAATGARTAVAQPAAPAAGTICVGGAHCYRSIQAAVDAAGAGATIRIGRGSFRGGVRITRNVNLVGESAGASKIVGGGPVVTIGAATRTPTVRIVNLTIAGGLTTSNPQSPHCGPDVPTCGPGYPKATALGGGVEAFPGTTVTIVDSVVTGNRAAPATSVPSVKAVCPGNLPCRASFGDAAGIDDWGTMTLIGTTVSNNHAAAAQSNGGGIAVESAASLVLRRSAVRGNSAAGVFPIGRFVSGGGIFVDGRASLEVDDSRIADNSAVLANTFPSPYPKQDGGTDAANSIGGGIFLTDGSTATIRNSVLEENSVRVDTPRGRAFGADAALCACGSVPLVLRHTRIDANRLVVNVQSSTGTGPSGPGAIEADGNTTITDVRVTGNRTVVTAPTGDADAIGAVGFFPGGTVAPTVIGALIAVNTVTAIAPRGAATIEGGGITNNSRLSLTRILAVGNQAHAVGRSGSVEGGAIWNGPLFSPTSSLIVRDSLIVGNVVSGRPGITLHGGGLFTAGAPTTLTRTVLAHNSPDQCFGC